MCLLSGDQARAVQAIIELGSPPRISYLHFEYCCQKLQGFGIDDEFVDAVGELQ